MDMTATDPARELKEFKPKHRFFVGIDSDGCAFDTMEIKHKECFIPNIIKYWNLQAVSKYAREAAEFVNLYSEWRGINRWPALTMVFDLLKDRKEVRQRHVGIPEAVPVRKFIESGLPLGNPALKQEVARTNDPVLTQALAWSEAVNKTIEDMVKGVPPFPFVRESLEALKDCADVVVVSQTPGEALRREWAEHGIDQYAAIIAGQEMGSKKEHLAFAAAGRYEPDHVLMIGDAFGDYKAAKPNNALFFPINPGCEEASWELFYREALPKFLKGEYAGAYESKLFDEFKKYLPSTPPWKRH
jgi:phosphoglycolate phosphatase-like HAD superfamily hydrolase